MSRRGQSHANYTGCPLPVQCQVAVKLVTLMLRRYAVLSVGLVVSTRAYTGLRHFGRPLHQHVVI